MDSAERFTRCCTRQHLSLEEWGLLEDCLRLTHGGIRPFVCSGRDIAARFSATGKDSAYRVIKQLAGSGWLVRTGGGIFDPKTGKKTGTIYHIASHEEWIKVHGLKGCDQSGNQDRYESGNRDRNLSGNPDQPCLETQTIPVWKPRHKSSGKTLCKKSLVELPSVPQPSKDSFNQKQEIKGEAHASGAASLDSQTGLHTVHAIPDFAEYDSREGWSARRTIGRGLTAAEVQEIRQ